MADGCEGEATFRRLMQQKGSRKRLSLFVNFLAAPTRFAGAPGRPLKHQLQRPSRLGSNHNPPALLDVGPKRARWDIPRSRCPGSPPLRPCVDAPDTPYRIASDFGPPVLVWTQELPNAIGRNQSIEGTRVHVVIAIVAVHHTYEHHALLVRPFRRET